MICWWFLACIIHIIKQPTEPNLKSDLSNFVIKVVASFASQWCVIWAQVKRLERWCIIYLACCSSWNTRHPTDENVNVKCEGKCKCTIIYNAHFIAGRAGSILCVILRPFGCIGLQYYYFSSTTLAPNLFATVV